MNESRGIGKRPGFWAAWYVDDGVGWFRICGRGLHWKDTRRHRLLFSERNAVELGHFFVQVGPWRIRPLGFKGARKDLHPRP